MIYEYDDLMDAIVVREDDGVRYNVAIVHNHRQANYIIKLLNEKESRIRELEQELEELKNV